MSNYADSHFDEKSQNTSWHKVFSFIQPQSKVLDVGCSSGNFGKVLISKKQCTVDGIELDKKDAKEAAKKLHTVRVLDIEKDSLSGLGKNEYDCIYFGDVIEHLVDPVETLKRIKTLLKNSGAVVFSIPNMGHLSVRLDLLGGKLEATETGLLDKTHLHFYTQDEVLRVFEEAGYRIDKLDFVKKDYPKQLLEKHLAKLGLKANEKFYQLMQQTDAAAFQFVGMAVPSTIKKHKLPKFGPVDMFEKFYEDTKKNYEIEIKRLKNEIKILKYKTAHPYRNIASRIKGKIRK